MNMLHKAGSKKEKGFTLVELLIYMALMSIFLLVLLDVFTATLKTKLASESTSALNQDSRYILSKLSYDVNNAEAIISPTLGLESDSLQFTMSGSPVTYAIYSGNLVRTADGTSQNLNGTDTEIELLNFKNIGNVDGKPTIQVSYTVRSKIMVQGGKNQVQSVNTTTGTR